MLTVTRNVVVLNFFSTKCIPCIREIPTLNKLSKKFEGQTVRLVYINVDSDINSLNIKRFIARKQIKIPMMLPNQKEAVKKYSAWSLPRIVVIDKNGIIRKVITGFQNDLEIQLGNLIEDLI